MGMSPDAYIGWGVSLREPEYGEGAHESVKEGNLFTLANSDAWKDVVKLIYGGHCDYGFPVVFIKRTHSWANWGSEVINPQTLDQWPTGEELMKLNDFLDQAGFTGDRTIKLLLVASYG